MEIDLYRDLTAFNALSPEQQAAEAERLQVAIAKPKPPRTPARVVAAPAPVFVAPVVVDSPGSVILRAEDILPDDEPDPEPFKPVERAGRKVKMDDQLKVSGPLVDLGITSAKPNGGMAACPSCGSQSDGQDLFCIACGSFLNEPDVTNVEVESRPVCVDCGAAIELGEIFCPSCGSALPG